MIRKQINSSCMLHHAFQRQANLSIAIAIVKGFNSSKSKPLKKYYCVVLPGDSTLRRLFQIHISKISLLSGNYDFEIAHRPLNVTGVLLF